MPGIYPTFVDNTVVSVIAFNKKQQLDGFIAIVIKLFAEEVF